MKKNSSLFCENVWNIYIFYEVKMQRPSMPLEQSTYPSQILRIFGILGTYFKFSFHFISK